MAHSSDLRTRVLQFIENGGSKTEAAKRFKVGRTAIYRWLNDPDPLTPGKPGPTKPRLLDPTALAEHVKAHLTKPLKNALNTLGFHRPVSAMDSKDSATRAKKNSWI